MFFLIKTNFWYCLQVIYMLIAFFGTGNMATVSSFDPNWVRFFISTFSPFTMMILVVLKMLIPIFILVCTLKSLQIITQVHIAQVNNKYLWIILTLFLGQITNIISDYTCHLWYNESKLLLPRKKQRIVVGHRNINFTLCHHAVHNDLFNFSLRMCQICDGSITCIK